MRPDSRIVIQGRVLMALIMREMTTRFGATTGGYAWAVLEPAVTVALLSIIFSQISRHPPLGDNFAVFFATGYMAFHVYIDISRNVSLSIKVNMPLLTFPRVTILDPIIARFVLQLLTACFVSILILGGLLIAADAPLSLHFGPIFLAVCGAATLGLGVGMLNCVLFAYSTTWERTFNLVNRPLFLVSGVFFTYESLPRYLQDVLWWNPLIHITATMRQGFFPGYAASFVSLPYVAAAALTPLLLGILLLRALRGRLTS